MILCIEVLYIINARIRIVHNFVDRPSIWQYGFINKGTQRDMLYYCLTEEMSSKENSPAIGSFLWVVMLSMIMKP